MRFAPDLWLVLLTLTSALVTFAIFRKCLRQDGLLDFARNVTKRATSGEDLILFALGLCFSVVTLVTLSTTLELWFVRADWFVTMRRQINVLAYVILALYFLNGRLVQRIVVWLRRAGWL